ncbi:hypothetical protein E4K67_13700 [Desulfosporosinus fructosivorans]|uniref:Uncharacterized protein n=1 Tax=Desulfosporosinus fructosivorans TaxID=2018669 RepID=A0A4Z0R6P1_9FIRM|nr:hypothetical protein [Desulfosporosinus fructosivorans]TGE37763.1 hypothetical protein E4K67_13700 [Desulfosporosinus fructosivorans]
MSVPPNSPSLAASHIPVLNPELGVAYTEVCYTAYVIDVALVSHCVPGLEQKHTDEKRLFA